MHVATLVKIPLHLLKLSSRKWKYGHVSGWQPLAIPNQISTISMHISSLVKIYSSYHPETKIWACLRQITQKKNYRICPLAIPNRIFTISMHIPSLVKIHWFTQVTIQKWKTDRRMDIPLMDGHTDIQRETIIPCHYRVAGYCPLAIPNQISTISMHIQVCWKSTDVYSLSSRNEKWTDGRMMERHRDVQRETVITRHYHVAWYKNY